MTSTELKEMGEDANSDEVERLVENFRRQRLEEIKRAASSRFGRVYPIGREDYTREVTEESKVTVPGDTGKGTGVVCFLYKDGCASSQPEFVSISSETRLPRSERTFEHIRILAQRHPKTKFVSIVGDKCIPALPESRQPMLIIYRGGEVQNQIVAWGGDRERRLEGESDHGDPPVKSRILRVFVELEAVLVLCGAIIPTAVPGGERDSREEDSGDESEDARQRSKYWSRDVPRRTAKTKGDEDSGSELDI